MKSKIIFLLMSLVLVVSIDPLFASTKHKEIYFGEAKSITRSGNRWLKLGRITAELKNPPEALTVDVYSISTGKKVYTYKAPGKLYIFVSHFLMPGSYKLVFKAPDDGFLDAVLKKIVVKKGTDTMIKVDFNKKVFVDN